MIQSVFKSLNSFLNKVLNLYYCMKYILFFYTLSSQTQITQIHFSSLRSITDLLALPCCMLHVGFLSDLLFDTEDGDDMFIRKVD
jgi:hypothetical protein